MKRLDPISTKFPLKIKTFGNSMYPLLHDGDVIYINRVNFNRIKINDLVCARKKNKMFTHRVIYRTKNYLITKGDSNVSADGKIYVRNMVGKVYKIKRNGEIIDPESLYLIQSSLYFKEIVKVKKAFEKENLNFVLLKGLPLHLYYQGIHPRRFYADCDLLIERNRFKKATRILKNLGYVKFDTSLSRTQKRLRDKEVEIDFLKIVNGFPILFDIHLEAAFLMVQLGQIDRLYPQKLIDAFTAKLLQEKRHIDINIQRFPILSKENLFIYLVLHLYHHNFQGTHRFDLIKKLINKEELKYSTILETISKFRLDNFIYPCMFLFNKYYKLRNASIPLNGLRPSTAAIRLTKRNIRSVNIFDDEDRISSGVKRFENAFFLSPNNYLRKSLIFLNKQVLYSIYLVFSHRFSNILKSFS